MEVNHDEDGFEHDGNGQWPFSTFVEQLIIDMFDPGKRLSLLSHFVQFEEECGIYNITSGLLHSSYIVL